MIEYTPSSQLKIEMFKTPFEAKLSGSNRWVELGKIIPWDSLAQIYYAHLQEKQGRKAINARIVIGAMIIKHKLNLSDRETIAIISENPYMQHFLGLDVFHSEAVFDPRLFVTLRKRMGEKTFDAFSEVIIKQVRGIKPKGRSSRNKKWDKENGQKEEAREKEYKEESEKEKETTEIIKTTVNKELVSEEEINWEEIERANRSKEKGGETEKEEEKAKPVLKGKLKLDATVADIYIKYPTDLDLVNKSREWSEKIIDKLYEELKCKNKPRTYRRLARKSYLEVIKKKKKSKKVLIRGMGIQLNYLKRNLGHIEKMLVEVGEGNHSLSKQHRRYYEVIKQIYEQQRGMYQEKSHRCKERIVSLSQPYVRPIVRGKSKNLVEFGPKLGLSLVSGYTRITTMSWSPYHEGEEDFKKSIEEYYKLYGYYPELIQVDEMYASRENRRWAKEQGIRITARALGRPKKEEKELKEEHAYLRRKKRKEQVERNHIEGKIGQGKQGYRLNQIRTRTQATAASWISCIIFVMNLIKFSVDMNKRKGKCFLWFIYMLLVRVKDKIDSKQLSRVGLCLA